VLAHSSVQHNTLQLLTSEIEHLQAELTIKDARLAEYECQRGCVATPSEKAGDSTALESRNRQLLFELEQCDERIAFLEEMACLSDEASISNAEEQRQIDDWLREIEDRMIEREADVKSECDVLRKRLERAMVENEELHDRVKDVLEGGHGGSSENEILSILRKENESLREQLAKQHRECEAIGEKCVELERRADADYIRKCIDEEVRSERLQMAQERAALSRQKCELTQKLHELNEEMDRHQRIHPADEKFRVFRDTLAELHEHDRSEYVPPTISQRLNRLWKRLDGRDDLT
jgi:hypothetical protein